MTEVIFLDCTSILFLFAFSMVFSGLNTDSIGEYTAPISCSSFYVSLILKCWEVLASPFASSFPGTVIVEMRSLQKLATDSKKTLQKT